MTQTQTQASAVKRLYKALIKANPMDPRRPYDHLLDAYEVSGLLNVPEETVLTWAKQRELPYIKIGNIIRFRRCDIEVALAEHFFPSNSQRRIYDESVNKSEAYQHA